MFVLLFGGALLATGQPAFGQAGGDSSSVDSLRQISGEPPRAVPPDSVRAEDVAPADTSEPERAVVRADSLSALVQEGERVQELFGNVRVRQDTTRLRSSHALRYLERKELLFTGDVVIYERGDTLRADTVLYNKRTKVGRARSNVRLTDGEVVVRAPQAIYYTEEKRSVFPDSVTLVDSSRVLQAESGTYWSNERRAEFQGHVQLSDPETYLEADSLTYYRDRERSIAAGQVFIRRVKEAEGAPEDTTRRTYLFGNWADNQEQNRYSRVEGDALLVRVRLDSTGTPTDTLIVRGHRLEAFRTDTHRRLIAVDSVRIWQEDLTAVADSAVYHRVIAAGSRDTARTPSPLPDTAETGRSDAPVRPSPLDSLIAEVPPTLPAPVDSSGSATAPRSPARTRGGPPGSSDSSAVDPSSDTVRAGPARAQGSPSPDSGAVADSSRGEGGAKENWGMPIATEAEDLPLEETHLFRSPMAWFEGSQVWGDSIRVRAHQRSLDTVYVRGAAFAAQRDSVLDHIQQLKGKDLTAFFRSDSLKRIVARPNARAIRFLKSDAGTLKGAAKASGDRIVLRFREGEVKRVSVIGGVQSTYHRTPKTVPDPFHLQGFQWSPDRKPTRARLLQEKRVRERLDLGPRKQKRSPPIAQKRYMKQGTADSLAQSKESPRSERGSNRQDHSLSREGERPRPPSRKADSLSVSADSLRPSGAQPTTPVRDTSTTSKSNP